MWAAFGVWRDRRVAYCRSFGWPGGMDALLVQHMAIRRKLHEIQRTEPGQSA